MPETKSSPLRYIFPAVSAVVITGGKIAIMSVEGEIITHNLHDRFSLKSIIGNSAVLTCHAPWASNKVAFDHFPAFDILELFAFCKPAEFVTPTLSGIAQYLGFAIPETEDDLPFLLIEMAQYLLKDLKNLSKDEQAQCITIASAMARQGQGWAWAPYVLEGLGAQYDERMPTNPRQDLNIFKNLPEWAEEAPSPPSSFKPISGDQSREHLQTLLNRRSAQGRASETRAQQVNYTTRVTDTFAPKTEEASPHLLLAQAGTGIGKTFGYLAPAQLWSEENEGCITISTYTKNLQRQIEQDLDILYPDKAERARKAVVQKGRENYLCLLNLQDLISASALAQNPRTLIAAGLMARWVMNSPDGDMSGNSFPGWLSGILGLPNTLGLTDRRGECIYAACEHYHKCFIERMNRKAKRASIVINNHALTLIRAATQNSDAVTPFIVFDEAHHLFGAADSAFSANFTGLETADLRRWLIGPEDDSGAPRSSRSRGRGIRKRLEGLIDENSPAFRDIGKIITAAKESLPGPGWRNRVFNSDPFGASEKFLSALTAHVMQRAKNINMPYSIECDVFPVADHLTEMAKEAHTALKKIRVPLQDLSENLKAMMEDQADTLDKDTLQRLDSLSISIENRSTLMLAAWMRMLECFCIAPPEEKHFIDWFEITRIDGRNYDCGFMRRYKNPMEPLGNSLRHTAHGIVMTSATLRSEEGDNWQNTFQSLGTQYLTDMTPEAIDLPSPFDYKSQSKIFIVTDVDKSNGIAVSNAYKLIFEASNGGALGLFTSIQRLKQVNHSIRETLERKSIPLYAQHHDDIDIGTLTDMFREDENSCLLGTDAVRDGIDVGGSSLRCMVFDRVPWPRPTILHRERKKIFGGRAYDEDQTRLKLKQAYGRLIRTENDKGVFIMLDGAMPSRLLNAFPQGVDVERLPLKDVIKQVKTFL